MEAQKSVDMQNALLEDKLQLIDQISAKRNILLNQKFPQDEDSEMLRRPLYADNS